MSCCIYAVVSNQNTNLIYIAPSREVTRRSFLYNYACKLQLALVFISICIIKSFAWRRLTHVYVRIRGKHKQAKKERHCACKTHRAWIPRVGIEPRTSHSRGKKKGIKQLALISSTRCDGFTWWPKTHVFECQPPNWRWVGYELVIHLVHPIAIATVYSCNWNDPNNHCIAVPVQRPSLGVGVVALFESGADAQTLISRRIVRRKIRRFTT